MNIIKSKYSSDELLRITEAAEAVRRTRGGKIYRLLSNFLSFIYVILVVGSILFFSLFFLGEIGTPSGSFSLLSFCDALFKNRFQVFLALVGIAFFCYCLLRFFCKMIELLDASFEKQVALKLIAGGMLNDEQIAEATGLLVKEVRDLRPQKL